MVIITLQRHQNESNDTIGFEILYIFSNHFTEVKLYSTWNSNWPVLKMQFLQNGSLKWVVMMKNVNKFTDTN